MRKLHYSAVALLMAAAALWALAHWRDPEVLTVQEARQQLSQATLASLSAGETYYQLAGPEAAPVVVLIHGFSIPSYLWDGTYERLVSDGYRVLRFDLYGRGFSDRSPGPYDKALYVRQLGELLDALDLKAPVHLVGSSMGGLVAAEYAARNPTRVRSLSLLAPLSRASEIGVIGLPGLGDYLAVIGLRDRLASHLGKSFHRPEAYLDRIRDRYAHGMTVKGFRHAVLGTARDLAAHDHMDTYQRLAETSIPTLLIWGREDQLVPFEQAEAIVSLLPRARLIDLEGIGHVPHWEAAEQVDVALRAHFGR